MCLGPCRKKSSYKALQNTKTYKEKVNKLTTPLLPLGTQYIFLNTFLHRGRFVGLGLFSFFTLISNTPPSKQIELQRIHFSSHTVWMIDYSGCPKCGLCTYLATKEHLSRYFYMLRREPPHWTIKDNELKAASRKNNPRVCISEPRQSLTYHILTASLEDFYPFPANLANPFSYSAEIAPKNPHNPP